MTKTIAFFSGFYLPYLGGIERYTHNVAEKLVEKGYRVIVVASQHDRSLKNEEEVDGIKIYRLPVHKIGRNRYPFPKKNKEYRALLAKIKNEKIDVFIANTRFQLTALLGVQLAAKEGKKAIVIEHGTTWLTFNNPVLDFFLKYIERSLARRVKKYTNRFYGVSKEAADWLLTFGIKAKGVLFNAVDPNDYEKFHSSEKTDKITLSFSGRLQEFKGVRVLLSAFRELSKEYENLELIIAGDGPLYDELRHEYDEKSIHFLGFVSHEEVMKINDQSDIFVLLSKIEGFSTSMLEAAMMENVIITTSLGGSRELIVDESYGYIIENKKETLLMALRQILDDKERMSEMKEKVSKRVLESFTLDKTCDAFENAFRDE